MKYVDVRDLPPCSLSPECLRLIDDLDIPAAARAPARLSHIQDLQDERQLRQLRSHVPGCPTCSALLAEARRTRTQQRTMLHHFLLANERHMPSTTESIFAALRREQTQGEEVEESPSQQRTMLHHLLLTNEMRVPSTTEAIFAALRQERAQVEEESLAAQPASYQLELVFAPPAARSNILPDSVLPASHQRTALPRHLLQSFLTLATVVAVILAAFGLWNRASNQSNANNNPLPHQKQPTQPKTALNDADWDSVVIGLTLLSASGIRNMTVYNFNAPGGQMTTLLSDSSNVLLDAVSQDGQSLLYEEASADTRHMNYAAFSMAASTKSFYSLAVGQAGNAIWMDNQRVLVSDTHGLVLALNLATGLLEQSWPIQTGQLAFYNQPFLYFVGADNLTASALYRINLAQAQALPQQVTRSSPNTRFWLSPDGTTVVYANRGTTGVKGIYAVDSDGSHERLLQQGAGIPLGYTANNTLLSLQQVESRVEVTRLTTTLPEQAQVILANAAPEAVSLCLQVQASDLIPLCDQNIALAPSGRGLLLHAYYANGSHSLVYDDLTTGASHKIKDLASGTTVQLPGWSKISSGKAKTSFAQPATLCA